VFQKEKLADYGASTKIDGESRGCPLPSSRQNSIILFGNSDYTMKINNVKATN
jgi:hypothetical protein